MLDNRLGLDPAHPPGVDNLCTEIVDRIGKTDALEDVRRTTELMRRLGERDDGLLAEARMTMRQVKQRCRDLAATHAQAAEFLAKVRREAEEMLRRKSPAAAGKGDGG
jgi:hypothetical protein